MASIQKKFGEPQHGEREEDRGGWEWGGEIEGRQQ